MLKNYILLLLTALFTYPVCAQTTINLNPAKDNSIYSENVNNSSGAGRLYAGQTCTNNSRRALMQFDVSAIPTGATINAVTLTLTSDNASSGALANQTFTIYALSSSFGEGTSPGGGSGSPAIAPDATWNANQFGTSLWATPGGDLSPLPVTSLGLPVATGTHVFPSTNIFISVVNSWLSNSNNNFGLILIGPAAPTCNARRFGSKEQGVAPVLSITYTGGCVPTSSTDVQTACDSYAWIDGNTYTSSNNTATHIIPNAGGCDSTITLNLTINNSTTSTDVQSACNTFTWIDGNTYTTSNTTATHVVNNAAGCDSTITLNLTISNVATSTDAQSVCSTFTWIDGNTYTTNNNTATFTIVGGAAAGCDSVITLDLTINNPTTSTDEQTACDSYTWIDGNTYTSSNNTATHVIPNAAGCDSTITLDLTINNSTTSMDVQSACGDYTWIDALTYTASNNTATFTTTNAAGCDSVVTLNLTINNPTTGTDVQSACESFTWIDGNTYTASNNTATFTIPNAAACDSLITLDLTIGAATIATTVSGTSITANAQNASFQWIDCTNGNAFIAGETNATYTATENGSYAVIVTQNTCVDTSACVNITNVSIQDNFIEKEISIYPNPTAGVTYFNFGNLENISIKVFNTLGQILLTENLITANNFELQLDGETGLYFIEVESNGKKGFFKVMKK